MMYDTNATVSAVAQPARVLIIDDNALSRKKLRLAVENLGYTAATADNGEAGLKVAEAEEFDAILLDMVMPGLDGFQVLQRLNANETLRDLPVIVVSALEDDSQSVSQAITLGAEDFLPKEFDPVILNARLKASLQKKRINELQGISQAQAVELVELNRDLEKRVADQLEELERISHLKRFFSPQLAELIVSSGDDKFMQSHRQEITVVFCDIRNFTEFSATAEPEEQFRVLREYHEVVGSLIFRYEATLEHFAGDGVMSFFNDPVPCPDPAARAVRMAVDMRSEVSELIKSWNMRGFDLGFGVGIALGYATLGQVGFEGQFHYMAIGSVANLASRLCDQAENGEILITQRVFVDIEELAHVESNGELNLKGFPKPVPTFQVVEMNLKDV